MTATFATHVDVTAQRMHAGSGIHPIRAMHAMNPFQYAFATALAAMASLVAVSALAAATALTDPGCQGAQGVAPTAAALATTNASSR